MSPRLLRPRASAPAAFSPAAISGLFTWWDLSDSDTVTLNSGNVSAVADKSGNGNYPGGGGSRALVQSSAGDQPPYNATLQNGLGGAVFDQDAYLYSGSNANWDFLVGGTDRYSLFMAAKSTYANLLSTAAPGIELYDFGGSLEAYLYATGGTLGAYIDPFPETDRPSVFHFAGSPISGSPSLSVSVDTGNAASTSDTFSTIAVPTDSPLAIGHNWFVGENTLQGELYEVLIYRRSTALSGAEATAVVNYLKAKWGIG